MALGILNFTRIFPGTLEFADNVLVLDSMIFDTESITIDFVGIHASPKIGTFNTTTTLTSSILLTRELPRSGTLARILSNVTSSITLTHTPSKVITFNVTTASITSIFSAHATTYGTFEKILPNLLTSSISGKFTWFFITLNIQVGPSIIPFIRIALATSVTLDSSNLLLNSGQFIGTVPLRYEVTIFSYLDYLQRIFVGKNYPAGSLNNNSLTVKNVNMSGIVPIAIELTLVILSTSLSFDASGISLIGVNLVPNTNTVLTQLFVRVDLPKNITFNPVFYCSAVFYGHAQNYAVFEKLLKDINSSISVLVPLIIQGDFDSSLSSLSYSVWNGRVPTAGHLESELFTIKVGINVRCYLGGSIDKILNTVTSLLTLNRKDFPTGNLILSNLNVVTNIYIRGNHFIPKFNPTITNTVTARFIALATKIGVTIDIRNDPSHQKVSFTGPFFNCISYIQAQFTDAPLENLRPFIKGGVSVDGHLYQHLPVYGNFFVLITVVGLFENITNTVYSTFSLFFGIQEITGHLYKILQSTVLDSNFAETYFGPLALKLDAKISSSFLGYHTIRGTMPIITKTLISGLELEFTTYEKTGYLILNTENLFSVILSFGGQTLGNLNLNLTDCFYASQASHTFLKLELNNLFTTISMSAITLIYGTLFKELPLEIVTTIRGGVPISISVVMELVIPTVKSYIFGQITTKVSLDIHKFNIFGFFYGTCTTGSFDVFTNGISLTCFAFRGQKPSFYVELATETITSEFIARINTIGTISTSMQNSTISIIGITPIIIFGSFVSSIVSTISSNIKLRNLKNFFLDQWQITTVPIESFLWGSVFIAGTLQNNGLNLTSFILVKTPIAITTDMTFVLSSPQLISQGWIPLYGQLITTTKNDSFSALGTHTVGGFFGTLEFFVWRLKGVTPLRVEGSFSLITNKPTFIAYGYLLLYRGTLAINVPETLFGTIKAHTPVVNNEVYFGSFLKTLSDFKTNIFVRLELVHGVLENVLNFSASFVGWSILIATFDIPSQKFGFKLNFIDSSVFVVGVLDIDTQRNTTSSTTIKTRANFYGFTKIVVKMNLTTPLLNFKINLDSTTVFRGFAYIHQYWKNNILYDTFPTPESIMRGIVPKFVYGKFESAVASLINSDINFKGVAATRAFGTFEVDLKDTTMIGAGFFPFYLILDSTLRPLTWYSVATNYVIRMDAQLENLNELKNKITGIAAFAVYSTFVSDLKDFYQPLIVDIRGGSTIYGTFKTVTSSITGYLRTFAEIVGYIIGGDTIPCDAGRPCFDQNLLPDNVSKVNPPKQYWTLGYTTSSINLKYIPTRFYGFLNGTLNEHKLITINYYDVDLKKIIVLNFFGTVLGFNYHLQSSGFTAIKGTFDCNEDSDAHSNVLRSFYGWKECEIYGQINVKVSGTFNAEFKKGIMTFIELRTAGISATLASDLPLVYFESYGLISTGGRFNQTLDIITTDIKAVKPLDIFATFNKNLDVILLDLEIDKPFQLFGRFINYYLLWLYGTFNARTLVIGNSHNIVDDVLSDFKGTINNILGTMDSKFSRIYMKIYVNHIPNLLEIYGVFDNQLELINENLTIMTTIFGRLTDVPIPVCVANIRMLVPIRIFTTIRPKLENLITEIKLVIPLQGQFVADLRFVSITMLGNHIKPLIFTLDIVTNPLTPLISGLPFPTGHFNSILNSFTIENIGMVGNSYGYLTLNSDELTCVSELWTAQKSLYLPNERLYAIAGEITATSANVKHTVSLYDLDSGELMERISKPTVPSSYSFNKVEFGRFVVVATPLTGSFRSQAFSVLIDEEVKT